MPASSKAREARESILEGLGEGSAANITVKTTTIDEAVRRLWASKGLEVVSEEVSRTELGLVRWTVTAREIEHRFGSRGRCSGCHMELTYYEKGMEVLKGWPADSEKEDRMAELKNCRPWP